MDDKIFVWALNTWPANTWQGLLERKQTGTLRELVSLLKEMTNALNDPETRALNLSGIA